MSNLFAKQPKTLSVIALILVCLIASIEPLDYPSYLLHQVGTVMMVTFLYWANRYFTLSTLAFVAYVAFLMIHVIAAHWLYSYVPYNDWFITLLGLDINQTFGFSRNMFDRVVHIAYGFLLYPIVFELLSRYLSPLNTHKIHTISIGFVMASSMFYELIEWWIAITLSNEHAENYNGQQGDVWDAHKDMFLATLASMIAVMTGFFSRSHIKKPQT